MNDRVRKIEIRDSRSFVRTILQEAGREDLFTWVDDRGLTGSILQAVNELAVIAGGDVKGWPGKSAPSDQYAKLPVLIGRRYHLNLKETIWQSLIVAVPIIVILYQSGGLPDWPLSRPLMSIFEAIRQNLQKLEAEELVVYLAVKALNQKNNVPATAGDITAFLATAAKTGKKWKVDEVQRMLERMANKKVLKESNKGFRVVI